MSGAAPIKAIETAYKGYRFRSRLEARWAVFFDSLGLRWEYEPEGFETSAGWYLPDFSLWSDREDFVVYVEVRPTDIFEPKVAALNESFSRNRQAHRQHCQFVFGDPYAWFEWRYREPNAPSYLELCIPLRHCCRLDYWRKPAEYARSARFEHGAKP